MDKKKSQVGSLIQFVTKAATNAISPDMMSKNSPERSNREISKHLESYRSLSSQVLPTHVEVGSMDPLRALILEDRAQSIVK